MSDRANDIIEWIMIIYGGVFGTTGIIVAIWTVCVALREKKGKQ